MQNTKKYYMPAEWETHERTFIEWPVRESLVWPDNYDQVVNGYRNVINAISQFEPVTVIVNKDTREQASELTGDNVTLMEIPHNDAWCRDNGPTFVYDQNYSLLGINWEFNAWGERFTPYDLDNAVASEVLANLDLPREDGGLVLEGGSIHVDGQGTLLTTRECLLNKNRNPHMSQEEIEKRIKPLLGVDKIIWLNHGLYGDETDGHIDNIACFIKPGVVLIQTCRDPQDPNYAISQENLEILRNAKDAQGRPLEIIQIDQPPARYYKDIRLTLSYLNYYIVNNGIILPVFGGDAADTDKQAIELMAQLYPDHQVVTVDGMDLIKEGGNVHCITQQMPSRKFKPGEQL
ncbi:MAG: agmatine deiminase family protein [Erysipelotrichaceae bacterium]|nr:agmatine deiminase family protein [Erysipelotrichaceae bacterium]